ncbi:acyltransferase family protein [soil metagenome]
MTTESTPVSALAPAHRRPDIQGLRAIAVLGVIVFHAFHPALPGGFVGVDIFFVLSGFLITGILMRELDEGRFSLGGFYRRRISRLFPALFVVLAFTLAVGFFVLAPRTYQELSLTTFFTTLFTSNLAFIRISGYFDADASLRPLLHTWSLGVEEQFYLLFPPLLWALHRFARRLIWPVLAVLAAVSLWKAQQYLGSDPTKAFYHPFCRAVELLVGALAYGAARHWSPGPVARQALSLGGAIGIVGSLVLLNDKVPFPGVWAMPACVGTAAMLLGQGGLPNRWLEARPLVVVGDMSYSLYLWHWPLLVFGHLAFGPSAWVTGVAVVLSFAAAWLSRRYVEAPFLDGTRRPVWWMAGAAMLVTIGVCLAIYLTDGAPRRFSGPEQAMFAAAEDHNPDRKRCHKSSRGTLNYADTCVFGAQGRIKGPSSPTAAVWADSVGAELGMVYGEALGRQGASVRSITASGCPAQIMTGKARDADPVCAAHNAQILAGLTAETNIRTVVLIANWRGYEAEPRSEMPGSLFGAALALKRAGKQVVLVGPLPGFSFDPPSEAGLALRFGGDPRGVGITTAQYDRDNRAILAEVRAFGAANEIPVISPRDLFCDAKMCRVYDPKEGVLFFDSVHPSLTGARRIAARVAAVTADAP